MALTDRLRERQAQKNATETPLFGMREKILGVVRQEIEKMKIEIQQEMRAILEEKIGQDGVTTLQGERGFAPIAGVDFLTPPEMAEIKEQLRGRPGMPGKDGKSIVGSPGPKGKDGHEITQQELLEKINQLEERVEQKTIKGLIAQLHNLQRAIKDKTGGARGGGDSVRFHDLSGSTDGSTKTFTIPRHLTNKTMVFGTQFPHIYRPTVDFTETETSITLTSAVGAPQTGQSLVVFYVRHG